LYDSSINYEVPTWNQIYDLLMAQAQKIHNSTYFPDIVVAISRGGIIPARVLVDLLEVHQLATIQIQFYIGLGETKGEPILKQALSLPINSNRILLVDDIADTGKSLQYAISYLNQQGATEIKTATLYYKTQSIVKPDFYEKQTCSWVVFPWEPKETLRKIIQKFPSKRNQNHEIAKLVRSGLPEHLTQKMLIGMQEYP